MGRNTADNLAKQEDARRASLTNMAVDAAQGIPSDYTPEQKAAITTTTLGSIDTQFKNTNDEMMRRASATGSSAGLPETLLESGRQDAQTKAEAASGLTQEFANVPVQRALQKASIFAPLVGAQGNQQASNSGWFDNLLGSAMGAAGAAFSGRA
jgi:hypothetical protein